MPDHGGHLKGCSRYLKPYTLNFKPERCLSQKMLSLLTLPSTLPKDVPQKKRQTKIPVANSKIGTQKISVQEPGKSSGPEDDPGDFFTKQTRGSYDSSPVQLTGHLPLLGSSCGYGGQQKMGVSTTLFPAQKVCIAKKIWGHSGNFRNMCFFGCFCRLSDHALTSLYDILCRMAEFRPPCFTVEFEAWQTYLLQPSTEKNLSAGPFWNFPPDSGWVCSDPQQQPLSCIAKWGWFRL